MHIQRIIILVASVIGMLAVFLPWVSVSLPFLGSLSITGMNSDGNFKAGFVNLILFTIPLVFSLINDRTQPIRNAWILGVVIPMGLILLWMIVLMIGWTSEGLSVASGMYLTILMCIGSSVVALVMKGNKPAGPQHMGPPNMGPPNMGHPNTGPTHMGPQNTGPTNMGPQNTDPTNMGPPPVPPGSGQA